MRPVETTPTVGVVKYDTQTNLTNIPKNKKHRSGGEYHSSRFEIIAESLVNGFDSKNLYFNNMDWVVNFNKFDKKDLQQISICMMRKKGMAYRESFAIFENLTLLNGSDAPKATEIIDNFLDHIRDVDLVEIQEVKNTLVNISQCNSLDEARSRLDKLFGGG